MKFLVKVVVAGINPTDWKCKRFTTFPELQPLSVQQHRTTVPRLQKVLGNYGGCDFANRQGRLQGLGFAAGEIPAYQALSIAPKKKIGASVFGGKLGMITA